MCASGCAKEYHLYTQHSRAVMQPVAASNIKDLSARFESVFCSLLQLNPQYGEKECQNYFYPHYRSASKPIPWSNASIQKSILYVVIPGILGECIIKEVAPFEYAIPIIESKYPNVKFETLNGVSGRASSGNNAKTIEREIRRLDTSKYDRVVVIGYSKGTTDFLHYLRDYYNPVISRIDAFVSIAGVVNGTAIADSAGHLSDKLVGKLPIKECQTVDESGIRSLSLKKQFKWLGEASHIFQLDLPMYSLVTSSPKKNTSLIFQAFHQYLSKAGGINDGQVNAIHQILPSSKVLGYMNADHWAVILPFSRKTPDALGSLNKFIKRLATKNNFPREVLLESIVRITSSDLSEH